MTGCAPNAPSMIRVVSPRTAPNGRGYCYHGPFGIKIFYAPTYGTASRISTVAARPFGRE
jgi:hypothetical protein